jgi:Holliday junction resolvasome RuvABC ATP-dependent DNA helicase subunit
MKARKVDRIDVATAMQRCGKHVSMATNEHATIEEPLDTVFSMWSMLRLYNKDEMDKLVSRQPVGGQSQWLAVLSYTVSSRYLATNSGQTEFMHAEVVVICRVCNLVICRVCKLVRLL